MRREPKAGVGVDELRRTLSEKAYLFDDPRTYIAGIEDTIRAVEDLLHRRGETDDDRVLDVREVAKERLSA